MSARKCVLYCPGESRLTRRVGTYEYKSDTLNVVLQGFVHILPLIVSFVNKLFYRCFSFMADVKVPGSDASQDPEAKMKLSSYGIYRQILIIQLLITNVSHSRTRSFALHVSGRVFGNYRHARF